MNAKPPLVLATDGTSGCMGAVHMARAVAEYQRCRIVAVSVLEPLLIGGAVPIDPMIMRHDGFDEERAALLRQRVEEQLCDAAIDPAAVEVQVEFGQPAREVVRVATERGAGLIVVGLGRHTAGDRWLGSETALRVVQHSHIPVLAADARATGLPRRALIAVDFSAFSRDAARAAVDLLPPNGEAHFAHVAWSAPGTPEPSGQGAWIETYRVGARTRLDDLRSTLVGGSLRTTSIVLDGETSRALLKYASMSGAELIATGSHGYGFLGRLMMGSVSTRLLRQAPCSVLVAPPRGVVVEAIAPVARAGTPAREPVCPA